MKCNEKRLVGLIRGTLTQEECSNALRHLEECPVCRERAQVMVVLEAVVPDCKALQNRRKFYLLAAGFLFCALIPGVSKLNQEPEPSPDTFIQMTESRPYPYFPLEPRSGETESEERRKAFQAYVSGDYPSALASFSQLGNDPELLFFRAVCEYQLGQNQASLQHLAAAASMEVRWKAPALWYQANLYLRIGDVEMAAAALEELDKSSEEYSSEAASLLQQLGIVPKKEPVQ